MTQERIAFLRATSGGCATDVEMLDEIERLSGLVRQAHQIVRDDEGYVWCSGCLWNHETSPCSSHVEVERNCWRCEAWVFDNFDGDAAKGEAAHAAHVEALLNGGAR